MPLIWIGLLLLGLRAFGVEPVAGWPWFWVLSPFALAFVWFEIAEPLLGLNRVADPGNALAETRRRRVEAMFPHFRFRRKPSRPDRR
ncbi:MAG: TIGR04438 family Trp-rich protein [Burkholderiaceae bacterium]